MDILLYQAPKPEMTKGGEGAEEVSFRSHIHAEPRQEACGPPTPFI